MKSKKKKNKPAKARREAVEREATGPTPETAAKAALAPGHPVQRLIDTRKIDSAGEHAVREIELIYKSVIQGLDVKISRLINHPHGIKDVSDYLDQAHAKTYKPWCERWKWVATSVVNMIIDGRSPGVIEDSAVLAIKDYAKQMQYFVIDKDEDAK